MALACDLELDTLPCCAETHKWAWFRRYCTASRVLVALDKRTPLPHPFLDEVGISNIGLKWLTLQRTVVVMFYKCFAFFHQVAKKIRELMADYENMNTLHESHDLFKREQDEQLVLWMNR